jgi:hypothetical protein
MVRLGYTNIIDLNFFLVLVRDRMHGVLNFVSGTSSGRPHAKVAPRNNGELSYE